MPFAMSTATQCESVVFALFFGFKRDPHVDRRDDFARGRLADVDAFSGDQFTRFEIEAGPWLGHAPESHLLDWPSGGGIHDCRGNAHSWRG
jgi:hypothetical protein